MRMSAWDRAWTIRHGDKIGLIVKEAGDETFYGYVFSEESPLTPSSQSNFTSKNWNTVAAALLRRMNEDD